MLPRLLVNDGGAEPGLIRKSVSGSGVRVDRLSPSNTSRAIINNGHKALYPLSLSAHHRGVIRELPCACGPSDTVCCTSEVAAAKRQLPARTRHEVERGFRCII
eukprot:COSAG02_NODE_4707_length_5074_cov_3.193311_2_plen_104_part_00